MRIHFRLANTALKQSGNKIEAFWDGSALPGVLLLMLFAARGIPGFVHPVLARYKLGSFTNDSSGDYRIWSRCR